MAWYVDTSAFVKLVLDEPESLALRDWVAARDGQLVGSDLVRVEALRATRSHSIKALTEARAQLGALVLLRLSPALCARASELDPGILRTLDALHLASALALEGDLDAVVTYDIRLADAAALHGLPVVSPR